MTTILKPETAAERDLGETWEEAARKRGGKAFDPALHPRDPHTGEFTDKPGSLAVVDVVAPSVRFPEPRYLPSYGLSPKAEEIVYQRLENVGITHAALCDEIATRIGGPRAPIMDEAFAWYPEAHGIAASISGSSGGRIDQQHAQAVLASLSPQTEWNVNVAYAEKVCDFVSNGNTDGMTPAAAAVEFGKQNPSMFKSARDIELAMRLAMGEDINTNLQGLKVRSFYNNIDDPGGSRDVTLDTHMVKAFAAVSPGLPKVGSTRGSALGLLNVGSKEPGEEYAGAGYTVLSNAVRAVATEWNVPASVVQAAYWLQVQDTKYEDMKPAGETEG